MTAQFNNLDEPAIYVNQVTITVIDDGVRFTFNESSDKIEDGVRPRCSIFMSLRTARRFTDLCNKIMDRVDVENIGPLQS